MTTTRKTFSNVNEYRTTADGKTVHRYRIIGTPCVDYVAMESATFTRDGSTHSTFSTADDGTRLGHVPTRRLPDDLAALPSGDERIARVRAFFDACYAEAYAAIVEAFPEAADGERFMGKVSKVME